MPKDTRSEHPSKKAAPSSRPGADPVSWKSDTPEQGGNSGVPSAKPTSEAMPKAPNSKRSSTSGSNSATHNPYIILNVQATEGQAESGQVVEVEIVSEEEGGEKGKEIHIQNRFGIGLDVHSKFIVVSVLVKHSEKVILFTKEFDTSFDEIRKAKEWAVSTVESHSDPPVEVGDDLNYCLESTSTLHFPIIRIWEGKPAVVNPMLAKSGRRKTDVLDSINLATFDLYGTWARTYVIPTEVHELRVLVHEREHYEKLATQCVNRIVNTLTRFACTIAREGSIVNDPDLRAKLEGMLSDPPVIPPGYFPEKIPDSVRRMLREELEAYDVYSANAGVYLEHMLVKARSIQWDFGDGKAPGDKVIKILTTAPQVGEITAVTFLANIVTPRRFPNPKALSAYCGFDPSVQTSAGHKTSNKGRGGNKAVHDMIGTAASRLIWRHSEMFGKWGSDLIKKGASHNKARNAVARRLVVSMYYMLLKGEPFSYEDYTIAEKAVIFNTSVDDLVLIHKKFLRYIDILHDEGIHDTRKLIIEYYSCNLNNIHGLGRKFFILLKDFIENQRAYKKTIEALKAGEGEGSDPDGKEAE